MPEPDRARFTGKIKPVVQQGEGWFIIFQQWVVIMQPDLFFRTNNKLYYNTPALLTRQRFANILHENTGDPLKKNIDIAQILSLPCKVYDEQKKELVSFLRKKQKKLNLDRDSFRFIIYPPARMRGLEEAVFGKVLMPEERLSCYKMNIKNQQDFVLAQQARTHVQSAAADEDISRFFATGHLLLMVLNLFMSLAKNIRANLQNNHLAVISLLTGNSGKIKQQVMHSQKWVDWLTAYRKNARAQKDANPSAWGYFYHTCRLTETHPAYIAGMPSEGKSRYEANRRFNPKNIPKWNDLWDHQAAKGREALVRLKRLLPEIAKAWSDMCESWRDDFICNNKFDTSSGANCRNKKYPAWPDEGKRKMRDHYDLIFITEMTNWLNNLDNDVSAEVEKKNSTIQARLTDSQSANSETRLLLDTIRGARGHFGTFR